MIIGNKRVKPLLLSLKQKGKLKLWQIGSFTAVFAALLFSMINGLTVEFLSRKTDSLPVGQTHKQKVLDTTERY